MWVELTAFFGQTLSHEHFKKTVMDPGDDDIVDEGARNARVLGAELDDPE